MTAKKWNGPTKVLSFRVPVDSYESLHAKVEAFITANLAQVPTVDIVDSDTDALKGLDIATFNEKVTTLLDTLLDLPSWDQAVVFLQEHLDDFTIGGGAT